MATIYLHIGAPKTATSTLQHVLAKNSKRLLKNGVLFPQKLRHGNAHHALVVDLIEKYSGKPMPDAWYGGSQRGHAWEVLQAEIKQHENAIHSVIISSELFFGQSNNLEAMLAEVSTYLQGHEVRVIVYLRRQDQLYSSFYNQDVKGIRQWRYSAYEFYQTHQIFEQSYQSLLNVWSEAFGKKNIIIRPYEVAQWLNGDIVQDFCKSIGTEPLRAVNEEHNESLGMIQLYIKRCLNRVGFDKSINEEVVRLLVKLGPENPVKDCLYINRRLYSRYREQWLEENRNLSDNYLKGVDLFSLPIPEADALKVYELEPFATSGYIKNMFNILNKGKHREHRQLFAKGALLMLVEQNLWTALDESSRAVLVEWTAHP
jgi:hypothetical protein